MKPGAKLVRIKRKLDNPSRALKMIGMLMVSESQGAFREQKFGTKSWSQRGIPNVMGIISDFAQGKKAPPARRFEGRPVLRDTGRLAASIAFRVVGNTSVEVGSVVPYAGVHQKGGTSESQRITKQMQTSIGAWLKGAGSKWKKRLGFLLNKKMTNQKLTVDIRPRP